MPRQRANARIDRESKPATRRTGLRLLRLAAGAKRGDVTWRLSAPRHENGATRDIYLGSWPAKTLRPDRCRLSAEATRTGPNEPETGRTDHDRRLGRRMGRLGRRTGRLGRRIGTGDRMHGASGRAHGSTWGPETPWGPGEESRGRIRGSDTGRCLCQRTGGSGARGPSERSKRAILGPPRLSPLSRPRPWPSAVSPLSRLSSGPAAVSQLGRPCPGLAAF
jgi:hypothetical protein